MPRSRFLGRLVPGPAPLVRATYSSRLLGPRYVYYMCAKGIDNVFNPSFTTRIFRFQHTPTHCGTNIVSHGPEPWEIIFIYGICCMYIMCCHTVHE
jgi:hypothetical protein